MTRKSDALPEGLVDDLRALMQMAYDKGRQDAVRELDRAPEKKSDGELLQDAWQEASVGSPGYFYRIAALFLAKLRERDGEG